MSAPNIAELNRYAELAFRARRQKIDDEYEAELKEELERLSPREFRGQHEMTANRLTTIKLEKLILGKAESMIEAYEDHGAPIDEREILKQLDSFSRQSMGGMASGFRGEASMRGARTGQVDAALGAKVQSFEREMSRRSNAAMTEARHLVQKRKLAQNRNKTEGSVIHNQYHLHGDNSRVNVQSTDQSVNMVYAQPDEIFTSLRSRLETAIVDERERAEIFRALAELKEAQGTSAFSQRLGNLLAVAANFTTVITPYLPALAELAHKALS